MLMTTGKLIVLRIYNITLGRFPFFSIVLKRFLTNRLIKNKEDKYVASSKFFTWSEIE